jgi:hypothetical protein
MGSAQSTSPDFGTPQGTARLASTAGFLDILGIKLGMPAETAMGILKANYPTAKITLGRRNDYRMTYITGLPREDPSKQWAYEIDLEPAILPGNDRLMIGISMPPNKQVVHSISRTAVLKAPAAVENIVAGLRKKYGIETAGVDWRFQSLSLFDGSAKTLVWIYDTQGKQLSLDAVGNVLQKNSDGCAVSGSGGMGAPSFEIRRGNGDGRLYARDVIKNSACHDYAILTALIQTEGPSQGLSGMTTSFTLTAWHWPLISSGAVAYYSFLDQMAQAAANRAAEEAKQRGTDVKY